jgi:hypothetical protein
MVTMSGGAALVACGESKANNAANAMSPAARVAPERQSALRGVVAEARFLGLLFFM